MDMNKLNEMRLRNDEAATEMRRSQQEEIRLMEESSNKREEEIKNAIKDSDRQYAVRAEKLRNASDQDRRVARESHERQRQEREDEMRRAREQARNDRKEMEAKHDEEKEKIRVEGRRINDLRLGAVWDLREGMIDKDTLQVQKSGEDQASLWIDHMDWNAATNMDRIRQINEHRDRMINHLQVQSADAAAAALFQVQMAQAQMAHREELQLLELEQGLRRHFDDAVSANRQLANRVDEGRTSEDQKKAMILIKTAAKKQLEILEEISHKARSLREALMSTNCYGPDKIVEFKRNVEKLLDQLRIYTHDYIHRAILSCVEATPPRLPLDSAVVDSLALALEQVPSFVMSNHVGRLVSTTAATNHAAIQNGHQ